MRILFTFACFVSCTLLFSSCKNKPKTPDTTPVAITNTFPDTIQIGNIEFHIDTITEAEFEKAPTLDYDTSETRNIKHDAPQVRRVNDTLYFKTETNKEVTLTNNHEDNDSYAVYEYKGKPADIGQYLTYGSFYEWFNYFLISETTGDTTVLWASPEISPGKKYLIAGNEDIQAGFTNNGFQLFRIEGKTLRIIGETQPSNWGPYQTKWISDNELVVMTHSYDATQTNNYRTDYLKLSMKH